MSPTWRSEDPPPVARMTVGGWSRCLAKGTVLGLVVFGGLGLLLLFRLAEAPLFGHRRPWTPWITQFVCRVALAILGIRLTVHGAPMTAPGAIVANHSSWLDIFVLNALGRIYFVSKSEVAGWPGIGWLARATGTVFINRDPREAKAQQRIFEDRLIAGHRLVFFPEGTSTDGLRVLPFKTTLFAAFLAQGLRDTLSIQPATVVWTAPKGEDPRYYGWWGDMDFGAHLVKVLAAPRQGGVVVTFHPPLAVSGHPDRKRLAAACETAVRQAFPDGGSGA